MIVYLSAFNGDHFYRVGRSVGVRHYLYSFHDYQKKGLAARYVPGDRLFIDSGGYSARVKGVKIDIGQYIEFCKQNAEYIEIAANLDTNDVAETLANQRLMMNELQGKVRVLPIYHASDFISANHKDLLDKFIAEGHSYIGVGGVAGAGASKQLLNTFLSYVFLKTRDKVKVHGFGITADDLLKKYPFYSVDSTSWQAGMRYGSGISHDGKRFSWRDKKHIIKHEVPLSLVKQGYMERLPYEIKYWLGYEKSLTELWKTRGIDWKH